MLPSQFSSVLLLISHCCANPNHTFVVIATQPIFLSWFFLRCRSLGGRSCSRKAESDLKAGLIQFNANEKYIQASVTHSCPSPPPRYIRTYRSKDMFSAAKDRNGCRRSLPFYDLSTVVSHLILLPRVAKMRETARIQSLVMRCSQFRTCRINASCLCISKMLSVEGIPIRCSSRPSPLDMDTDTTISNS